MVSIVLPTYNYAHYLDETITSALDQTYTDFELIIIDNNSQDKTDSVVAKYLKDPRVTYHKNPENLGVVGNFNKCLELANRKYIKFLNADDKIHPEMVAKYVRIMEEYPGVSIVTCDKQAFGTKSHQTITPLTHLQPGRTANLHMILGNYCWIGEPTSVMIRKSDLKVGKFSYEYKQYVDFEFWIRLLTVGDCYIIPEILAYVRFHTGSVSKQMQKQRYVSCFEEYQICKDVQQHKYNIDTSGTSIDDAVRKRAENCIRQGMLKTIPELHKKPAREAFIKAFRIARDEKLISATIGEVLQIFKRKTLTRTAK